MTTLKDKVYDAVILDILQDMFEIDPTAEQRGQISDVLDIVFEKEEIESEEVN